MFGRRGKGNRRFPGREGGARKRKRPEWHKQAMHAVDDISELGEPLVSLNYRGEWGKPPSVKIHKFDQKIAKTGIRYHAEYLGRWNGGFIIRVLDKHAEKVQNIISEI